MNYSVVSPIYNEGDIVKLLYKRITKVLNSLHGDYEIIFIDDGSTDSSYKVLKDIAISDKNVKVISFKKNFGQHKAVIAGFLRACGDYIITLDADLQNPPEEIPKLVNKAADGFDIVSGQRKVRKDKLKRRICSYLTNCMISIITGLRMKDYSSMLKLYKKETAKDIAFEFMRSECFINILIAKITRNIAEIEVGHDNRYAGSSKYNLWKLIVNFLRVFCYYDIVSSILIKKSDRPLFRIGRKIQNGQEIIISS